MGKSPHTGCQKCFLLVKNSSQHIVWGILYTQNLTLDFWYQCLFSLHFVPSAKFTLSLEHLLNFLF